MLVHHLDNSVQPKPKWSAQSNAQCPQLPHTTHLARAQTALAYPAVLASCCVWCKHSGQASCSILTHTTRTLLVLVQRLHIDSVVEADSVPTKTWGQV